jgi:UDP-glucose:(heptosyl)LPS alpha-1,3-glucosyltransferase
MPKKLRIGLVRRGFSASGGAETYLKRLGRGLVEAGCETVLFTSDDWPPNEWPFGPLTRVRGRSAIAFADELEKMRTRDQCDVFMSLERIWRCDVYRAGDGVHRAWLQRRNELSSRWQKFFQPFNGKHREILRLEQSLLGEKNARRVIANSELVKREASEIYDYPAERIDLVYNGVPITEFRAKPEMRERMRAELELRASDIAVLFVGSGWERKGLRFAVEAIDSLGENFWLFVAGRGNQKQFRSARTKFLASVPSLPALYAAADIFLLPTLYDPFSNACLEALAAGLPVVTTRANGFSEIVTAGSHGSILEQPSDIAAIRRALEIWSNQGRREEARPLIHERASYFDISYNVAQTIDVLNQAAASASSASEKIRKT